MPHTTDRSNRNQCIHVSKINKSLYYIVQIIHGYNYIQCFRVSMTNKSFIIWYIQQTALIVTSVFTLVR